MSIIYIISKLFHNQLLCYISIIIIVSTINADTPTSMSCYQCNSELEHQSNCANSSQLASFARLCQTETFGNQQRAAVGCRKNVQITNGLCELLYCIYIKVVLKKTIRKRTESLTKFQFRFQTSYHNKSETTEKI